MTTPGLDVQRAPSRSDPGRDADWFEVLFRRHHRAVLAYAARRVPDEAEDVLSEVFAAAWRHRERLPDPPLPWLYRTAAHQILHRRRTTARRLRLAARLSGLARPEPADHDDEDGVASRIDDADRVAAVLRALPERDAEVLRLSAWEDLDVAGMAYVLGITPGAARVRLHRARRRAEHLLTATDAGHAPTVPATPAEEPR